MERQRRSVVEQMRKQTHQPAPQREPVRSNGHQPERNGGLLAKIGRPVGQFASETDPVDAEWVEDDDWRAELIDAVCRMWPYQDNLTRRNFQEAFSDENLGTRRYNEYCGTAKTRERGERALWGPDGFDWVEQADGRGGWKFKYNLQQMLTWSPAIKAAAKRLGYLPNL